MQLGQRIAAIAEDLAVAGEEGGGREAEGGRKSAERGAGSGERRTIPPPSLPGRGRGRVVRMTV